MIAITVEEEEDIGKFKDYKPTASDAAPAPEEKPTPSPPKEEVAAEPVTSKEPKVSKPSAAPAAEGRIFASPLARKIAEEHNVCDLSFGIWSIWFLIMVVLFFRSAELVKNFCPIFWRD